MYTINVAAVQSNAEQCWTEDQFQTKILSLTQKAARLGADIVVFPEDISFWLAWTKESNRVQGVRQHLGVPGAASMSTFSFRVWIEGLSDKILNRIRMHWLGEWLAQARISRILRRTFSLAARANKVIIVGGSEYVRKADGLYNVSPVFGRDGVLAGVAPKRHLVPIETSWGIKGSSVAEPILVDGINLGVCICYDLSFPDVCKELVEKGAELIAAPSAGWRPYPGYPFDESDEPQLLRAKENDVAIIRPYQCGFMMPGAYFEGHTMIVDGGGNIIASSKYRDREEIVMSTLTLRSR